MQPIVLRITVKSKVFQFALPEEVYVDKSKAQRSQTTGHLVVTMPRVNYKAPLLIKSTKAEVTNDASKDQMTIQRQVSNTSNVNLQPRMPFLGIST